MDAKTLVRSLTEEERAALRAALDETEGSPPAGTEDEPGCCGGHAHRHGHGEAAGHRGCCARR